ncbi:hypothetical protein AgCh_005848 [Apium graveolens]
MRGTTQAVSFKSFQAVKPPEFKGKVDHVVARIWLKEIEKAFALTKVSEDLKTNYASYFLKSDSNYWWESMRALEGEVIESDQRLAAKERREKKRKFEGRPSKLEQEGDSDIVAGTLSLNYVPVKILFDSGASKSFISINCVNKMQLMLEDLDEPLSIEVANQDKVTISQFCPKCSIEISGHSFPADLIPFELGEFDVILGMDWLSLYKESIDCKKKRVVMYTTNNVRISYQGQKLDKKFLSVLQANKLLKQGYEAYLAHVVDTKKETPTLDEIPIVREYPDVFLEEFSGLPPDHEIEFSIDLISGA